MPELGDVIIITTVSGRPDPEIAGRLAYVSDASPVGLYRDNGTDDWELVAVGTLGLENPMTAEGSLIVGGASPAGDPIELLKGGSNSLFGVNEAGALAFRTVARGATRLMEGVPSSGWTNVGLTCIFGDGGGHFSSSGSASDHIEARLRGASGGASRIFAAYFVPSIRAEDDVELGLCLNDSGSGEYITLSIGWDDTLAGACARVTYWDSSSAINSVVNKVAIPPGPAGLFITEDASSRGFYLSNALDLNAGMEIATTGLDHITAAATRCGFFVNPKVASGSYTVLGSIMHWHQG